MGRTRRRNELSSSSSSETSPKHKANTNPADADVAAMACSVDKQDDTNPSLLDVWNALKRIANNTNSLVNVAKCNLGKVNLELMLPAVSPSLHMIRGGAPLEFAGANYVQPCLLAIVAITASVSESLRIH